MLQTVVEWATRKYDDKDPVGAFKHERDIEIKLMIDLLGENNPSLRRYRRYMNDSNIERYPQHTEELTADWIKRYGRRFGVTLRETKNVARNLINSEILLSRLEFLNLLIGALARGNEADETIPVEYKIPGIRPNPKIILYPEEFHIYFGQNCQEGFEGFRDERVSWDYIFAGNRQRYEDWIKAGGFELIYETYSGRIGNLSEETLQEMSQLGWVIINRGTYFISKPLETKSQLGLICVGAWRPWEKINYPWVWGSLEHETQHMRDWRYLDGGLFNTPLLEIRALSKELVYLERMGYTEISEMKYRTLEPYIQILLGSISVEDTHVYRASMNWLVNGIKLLPDDKKCKLKSAIEGSIGR